MRDRLGAGEKAEWWKYLAVALGYGAGVWLFHCLDAPHFVLLCGVHIAFLLAMPYRYWAVMIMADVLVQLPLAIECAPSFGIAWSLLALVPSTLLSAPIIYFFRERRYLFNRRGELNIEMLLLCALLISAVLTGLNELQIAVGIYPVNVKPTRYGYLAEQWMLGNFLGILTVVPSVLAIREAGRQHGWRPLMALISESRAMIESVCFLLPLLVMLMWCGRNRPDLRELAQVAVFIPLVWLALRHGWRGAALRATVASLVLVWLLPHRSDFPTIQAEVVLAFAISTMLLVGARIEALDRQAEIERTEVRLALALAQRNMYLGEMQMRMTAQSLEQVREMVRHGFAMMIGQLRHLQPAIDDGSYRQVVLAAQDQLFSITDSLHPALWHERGLSVALREGAIARMLDQAGIRYWCELKGPVSNLSPSVHLAIYRMVCEAVADGCSLRDISDICVRLRGGKSAGRHWVVVSVLFRANSERLSCVQWDELLPRLVRTTTGMGIKAIRDRAATFEGCARQRDLVEGRSISWLMRDDI